MLQGLPHAASDDEPARSWWTDIVLAERIPINMLANRNFFSIRHSPLLLIILLVKAAGLPVGKLLWCRPGQKNNHMDVYRYRRWCMGFHTPQLRVGLSSIGGEITRPLRERP